MRSNEIGREKSHLEITKQALEAKKSKNISINFQICNCSNLWLNSLPKVKLKNLTKPN